MLFRPQLPPEPTSHLPATTPQHAHQTACACQHTTAPARPALPTVSTGAVATVIVGGVVITAVLAAVVVSAISIAVAAVVLRSLLANASRR
ncbi:SpdD protein [Streptomyces smyrnaeus]|uniref:SpdD protein n=1 Tax=Streptomyces smyrnaeus TaxID=1387713 RepID=UPI0033B0055F